MATHIILGGLTLNSLTPDSNGAVWKVDSFDGWEDPTVRLTTIELTGQNGVAVGEAFYGPFSIVIEGTCVTPSTTAMWASMAVLRAAITPQTEVYLRVNETTPKKVYVRLADRLQMKVLPGAKHFRFLIPLIAPDPTKVNA